MIEQGESPLAPPTGLATAPESARNDSMDGRSAADPSPGRRLPTRQPLRAGVLCLVYVLVVATAFAVLSGMHRPGMALFFTVGVAALLSVPLAVLMPVPRGQAKHSDDARPVLQRGSSKRRGTAEGASSTGSAPSR